MNLELLNNPHKTILMAQDKDQKTLNVPPLRFPGFTDEWKKTTLGDIVQIVKDKISTSYLQSDTYISTENILPNFAGINDNCNIPDNQNVTRYKAGDILLANIRPYLKKIWLADRNGGCNADVFVFRPNNINSSFVYYSIANDKFCDYVMSGAKGVKMPRGDKDQILKFETGIPSDEEQQRVVQLLSLIDERIATQNKIIEDLQSLIKGLAKTLTNQGEPNTRISNCLDCHTSTLQEGSLNKKSLYPVYGASGIAGFLDDYICDKDSILIIKDGSGAGTVSFATGQYSVIGTLNYLTAKSGYSLKYLYFCLMSFNFEPFKTGMAIPHIYFKDYGRAKIYCPSIAEQQCIAKTLTVLENKLNIELKLLNILYQEKRCLLSKMFI